MELHLVFALGAASACACCVSSPGRCSLSMRFRSSSRFPVPFPIHPLPPLLIAAGVIELVAGILVTLGLFTRLAAFIASGEMAVAYWMQHFPKSFWPLANMGEAAILFCFIFLYLAAAGPGAWSIDGARTRNAPIR